MFLFIFLTFIYFWDRERQSMNGGGSERGRQRIWNRFQALSCQHRAQCGARTHGPGDHDLSRSQPLNRLRPPRCPCFYWFLRERERVGEEEEREGDTESGAGFMLQAASTESNVGLEPMNREIMTWTEVWHLTPNSYPGSPFYLFIIPLSS